MHTERRRKNKYILTPGSRFMKRWDQYMTCLLLFTAIVTPPEVCFSKSVELNVLFFINRIVDFSFLCDMGINFNLSYEDKTSNEMVYRRSTIAMHYLKTWFVLDLISIIPFDVLGLNNGADTGVSRLQGLRVLRVFRLVKLLRIIRAGRIVKRLQT